MKKTIHLYKIKTIVLSAFFLLVFSSGTNAQDCEFSIDPEECMNDETVPLDAGSRYLFAGAVILGSLMIKKRLKKKKEF